MHMEKNELIKELETSKEYIYKLYYYDYLTELPNRKSLVHQQILSDANQKAVFMIDIDRFHSINELYGRYIGNQLLKKLAECLSVLFEDTTVYREGEDAFLIYLESIGD